MKTFKGIREELESKVADIIAEKIRINLKKKEKVLLGLPGGTSVSGIFEKLKEKDIQWEKVHIFMVDDRRVPLDHKESNFRLVKETLSKGNMHPYYYKKPIEDYVSEFKKFGDKFDIILLSAGEDGHTAGLFPNITINNTEDYFFTFDNSPKPPTRRMTASKNLLEKSNSALLLFFGENKKMAYKKIEDETISVIDYPAKLVNSIEDSYVLVTDD